jgi:hypothetical protein
MGFKQANFVLLDIFMHDVHVGLVESRSPNSVRIL